MKYFFVISLSMLANSAFAHPSGVPHDHPHVLNAPVGFDVILLAALAAGVAWIFAEKFQRS